MENEPDNNEEIETINTSSSINDNSGAESISSGQALKERVLKLVTNKTAGSLIMNHYNESLYINAVTLKITRD